jgi:hypothetical protein
MLIPGRAIGSVVANRAVVCRVVGPTIEDS